MIKVSLSLDQDNKTWEQIKAHIEALNSKYVKVGIIEGTGTNKDGVSIAQYAYWNEYGTGKGIPPRPFIQQGIQKNKSKIEKVQEALCKKVVSLKLTADMAYEQLALFMEGLIKESLERGGWTPNAPSTIKKKKSSRPLIDEGTLVGAIKGVVCDAGGS